MSRKIGSHACLKSCRNKNVISCRFVQLTTDKNDTSVHAELKKLVGNSKEADRELSNILMVTISILMFLFLKFINMYKVATHAP